ncbi:hypothetical protein ABID16_002583 [Rhizobium aquaticum]|uniref:Uncharacterized protein n=1 Tax=Rhizobium aquaticum TaxID=1549636 RepID=A0ABV2J1T5_9HYPH
MSKTAFMIAASFLAILSTNLPAWASSDDAKWIKQCVDDNKDQGAKPEVIAAYCSCMNGKMSSNETQSISEWEKTHVAERKACDKESGWR